MNYNEYISYESEIVELKSFLAEMPEGNVIERIGFEARLKAAQEAIKNIEKPVKPVSAQLTFRGSPVQGSHAIEANFAAKATELFTDAVSLLAVNPDNDNIAGPIPDKKLNQLLITKTAVGSFGFEFEIAGKDSDLFDTEQPVEDALKRIQTLFDVASRSNDEAMADSIDGISKKALMKLRGFLDYLFKQKAICGLSFQGRVFRFKNIDQLQHVSTYLKEENIKDTEQKFKGEFKSLSLGENSKFQFLPENSDTLVSGTVDKGINITEEFSKAHLWQSVSVTFSVRTVKNGKPRYRLENLDLVVL